MLPEDYALCTLLYPHSDSQCSGDLLRSHQPDLGHVAIHRPRESGKTGRGLFLLVWTRQGSSAGHSTQLPSTKLGFCWQERKDDGYWAHRWQLATEMQSPSLSSHTAQHTHRRWRVTAESNLHQSFARLTYIASLLLGGNKIQKNTNPPKKKPQKTQTLNTEKFKVQSSLTLPPLHSLVLDCISPCSLCTSPQFVLRSSSFVPAFLPQAPAIHSPEDSLLYLHSPQRPHDPVREAAPDLLSWFKGPPPL